VRIHVLAMGTRMPDWVEQGFSEYRKRLPGEMRLELEEIPLPKRGRNADPTTLVEQEAQLLRKRLGKLEQAYKVALDASGHAHDTRGLARQLDALRPRGQSLALLVGGPDGLARELIGEMDAVWSLSRLTLPHPLVRVVLAEQLYRCWSLIQGHPYHR